MDYAAQSAVARVTDPQGAPSVAPAVASTSIAEVLERLLAGHDLEASVVEDVFGRLFDGQLGPAQVAALAVAMRAKGETADELAAAAKALRARAKTLRPTHASVVVDTCGTGGDGAHTVNVSTMAAIVVAAAGATVAKHGNRAVSSRAGSADLIEALGIAVEPPAGNEPEIETFDARVRRAMDDARIGFLFAPRHHAAMRHAAPARRELGIRTLFNLLGPLANPGGATHQLVGVFENRRRPMIAEVLRQLGLRRVWVAHGHACEGAPRGLDEVSPAGETSITTLDDSGEMGETTITPRDAGLEPVPLHELAGGDARKNAAVAEALFAGEGSRAVRTAVVLNAACALVVAEVASDLREARERAEAALDRGDAARTLAAWRMHMQHER